MIHLEPCPFCGQEPEQRHRRYNPYARCATPDCMGEKLPLISLDVPEDIERWNRRYHEQALAAHVEAVHQHFENREELNPATWAVRGMKLMQEAPTTSLAHHKLLWQAEVLEEAGRYIRCEEDAALLRINAQELRHQAEEYKP